MAFYRDFAGCYASIFPLRRATLACLDRWLPTSDRILDVGCGTGAYGAALAASGRRCLGIDNDAGMIAAARAANPVTTPEADPTAGPAGDPAVEFQRLDMAEIGRLPAGSFGGAFCIGNVLPHLDRDRLPAFLAAVHARLRPGGVWVVQTVNFAPLLDRAAHDLPPIVVPEQGLVFKRGYRDITAHGLRFLTSLERDGDRLFAGEVQLYPLTAAESRARHEACGFTLVARFADFAGAPFDEAASGGLVQIFRRDG